MFDNEVFLWPWSSGGWWWCSAQRRRHHLDIAGRMLAEEGRHATLLSEILTYKLILCIVLLLCT